MNVQRVVDVHVLENSTKKKELCEAENVVECKNDQREAAKPMTTPIKATFTQNQSFCGRELLTERVLFQHKARILC